MYSSRLNLPPPLRAESLYLLYILTLQPGVHKKKKQASAVK